MANNVGEIFTATDENTPVDDASNLFTTVDNFRFGVWFSDDALTLEVREASTIHSDWEAPIQAVTKTFVTEISGQVAEFLIAVPCDFDVLRLDGWVDV
jgi:hypothetical protein